MGRVRVRLFAAMLLAIALASCGQPRISIPPAVAAPDVVLDTYLKATVAGDCEAQTALESQQLEGQCITLLSYSIEPRSGFTPFGPDTVQFYVHVTSSDMGNGVAGRTGWFCYVTRNADKAWKVTSCGTGP